ncbi:MAG: epoxyqueuosine reductase QueH [Desulfuromonadales bacterium]
MSLWRILLLLSRDLVPPGLQPERLEQALHYALADCIAEDQRLKGLAIRDDEPPLLDSEAIRLHHLASRMRQLGWPQSRDHCQDLIELLLEEVADRYGIESLEIIRRRAGNALWMNCLPPSPKDVGLLVAPRPILAGRVLLSTLSTTDDPMAYAEHWQSLQGGPDFAEVSAVLQTAGPIRRTEREARLVLLRQVWPNRRFEVPKEAPSWLWDALYLAGTPSEVLNLLLPEGWHRAAGLSGLWDALRERYQLTGLRIDQHSRQLLQWSANVAEKASLTLDRQADGHQISLPWPDCKPATIQLLARASRAALNYLQKADMAPRDDTFGVWTPALTWGAYIFLQTRFGQYLWALCDCGASTPELDRIPRLVIDQGVPLPNETCLLDLSSTWSPESWPPHDAQALEEEFTNILGTAPNVRTSVEDQTDTAKRKQPRKRRPIEEIVQGVFVDGRPDFPAQYLMAFYRPETVTYAIDGPLEITATFFDRITLQNGQTNRTLDVNGRLAAEALVLASHAGARQVKLPQDEAILASIVEKYRQELRSLWDQLIRECRRNFFSRRIMMIPAFLQAWRSIHRKRFSMKILIHICCGNCAIYPVCRLRESGHDVDGYFFNHNIHPYQEFQRRLQAVQQFASESALAVIYNEDYALEEFLSQVAAEPQGRCTYCYQSRLKKTAEYAARNDYDAFTSSLLYSRYQNHALIRKVGEELAQHYGIPFFYDDYRVGWQEGIRVSKEMGLYRQQYCGCIYSEKDRYHPNRSH